MDIWTHQTQFLGPIRAHNPNGISIGSAIFAQMAAECPYTLQWDAPFRLKIAASYGGCGPHLIHGSRDGTHPSPQPKRHLDRFSRFCRTYCCLTSFFPIVDTCLSCEDIARQSCAMVPRWRFLTTFCVLYFQRAACSKFQTCILNLH